MRGRQRTAILMGQVYRPYDRESLLALNRPAPIEEHDIQVRRNTLQDAETEYWTDLVEGELAHAQSLAMLKEYNDKRQQAEPRYVPPPTYAGSPKRPRTVPPGAGYVPPAPQQQRPAVNNVPQQQGGGGGNVVKNNNNEPGNDAPAQQQQPPQGGAGAVPLSVTTIAPGLDIPAFNLIFVRPSIRPGIELSNDVAVAKQTLEKIYASPLSVDPRIIQGAGAGCLRSLRLALFQGPKYEDDFSDARDIPTDFVDDAEWSLRRPVYEFVMGVMLAFMRDNSLANDPVKTDLVTEAFSRVVSEYRQLNIRREDRLAGK